MFGGTLLEKKPCYASTYFQQSNLPINLSAQTWYCNCILFYEIDVTKWAAIAHQGSSFIIAISSSIHAGDATLHSPTLPPYSSIIQYQVYTKLYRTEQEQPIELYHLLTGSIKFVYVTVE